MRDEAASRPSADSRADHRSRRRWVLSDVERLAGLLTRPGAAVAIVLAGVALCLPALGNGFILDDHMHRLMATGGGGVPTLARGPFGLFRFMFDDPAWREQADTYGFLPWYAAPHLSASFLRPLPSAMLWIEYRLGLPRPLAHVHDLAWYAVALAAVSYLYRVVLARHAPRSRVPAAGIAAIAALAFALDEAHGLAVGWTANRHAAMATAAGALALASHVRWRADGNRVAGVLGPVLLAVGLVCSELTLSITAYLFAYAAVLDRASPSRRILSLLPGFAVSVVWLVAYSAMGYGAGDSGMYNDPLGDPASYLAALPARLMLLLAGQWTPLQAESAVFFPPVAVVPIVVAACVLVFAVAVALVRHVRAEPVARFFVVGMLVGALPACAVFASDRNLFVAGIGAFGLLASWWAAVEAPSPAGAAGDGASGPARFGAGRFERATLATMVVVHFVVAPLGKPLRTLSPSVFGALIDAEARSLDEELPVPTDGTLVVVTTTDFFSGPVAIAATRRSLGRAPARTLRTLHTGFGRIEVTRVSDDAIEIRSLSAFQNAPFDRLLRPDSARFGPGDAFVVGDWVTTVLEVDADGAPVRVRFRAPAPLDDPSFTWVALDTNGYVAFDVPPVGTSTAFDAMTRGQMIRYALAHLGWPRLHELDRGPTSAP